MVSSDLTFTPGVAQNQRVFCVNSTLEARLGHLVLGWAHGPVGLHFVWVVDVAQDFGSVYDVRSSDSNTFNKLYKLS